MIRSLLLVYILSFPFYSQSQDKLNLSIDRIEISRVQVNEDDSEFETHMFDGPSIKFFCTINNLTSEQLVFNTTEWDFSFNFNYGMTEYEVKVYPLSLDEVITIDALGSLSFTFADTIFVGTPILSDDRYHDYRYDLLKTIPTIQLYVRGKDFDMHTTHITSVNIKE